MIQECQRKFSFISDTKKCMKIDQKRQSGKFFLRPFLVRNPLRHAVRSVPILCLTGQGKKFGTKECCWLAADKPFFCGALIFCFEAESSGDLDLDSVFAEFNGVKYTCVCFI